MDYHSLKRRELQALCKEHNIPANSANSVLADKLSALLNQKQKPLVRQRTCMKSSDETTDEGEPAASKRHAKKVRFSPSNDLVEYELRPGEKQKDMVTQTKARRKSVVNKVDKPKPVADNNTTVDLVDDGAQIPVKLTRSRVHLSGKDVVNPSNEIKDLDKETEGNVGKVTRSKAYTLKIGGDEHEESRQSKRLNIYVEKASESVEETVVSRARATRSKSQNLMEGGAGPDIYPHVKRKSGKQMETDGQIIEPSREIIDIPVRATRSRRQTQKEDVVNTNTSPQAAMKRTRREMKATDLSSNSSHVAPEDKQEPPKRKSLRTRGVKTVDVDEGDKVEVVNDSRVTRSKAPLAIEASGRSSKNKANKVEIQQFEEPVKQASKKIVNRRKSVVQTEKTEAVLHLEELVNRPARKNTRRTSVMQKATLAESPTVGKNQSKDQPGGLSMIVEDLEDKENVTRSGKNASEKEFKVVTSGSPQSRKRRGTPVIEDQIIENEYASLVDKPPKRSTRSAIKSEGKPVAKKQVESSLKKRVSKMNNQSSVENGSKGKSRAINSAIIRDSSSKKRAKLSGTKQSDSEDHDVNSSKEGTPVAKMGNFKLEEEVTKPEVTPAIKEASQSAIKEQRFTRSTINSERKEARQSAIKEQRFTRSTIRTERREPSQSAIKKQPIPEAQLSTPKAAKFQPDSVVNTAPGRITRTGIKHGGNLAVSFTEKVGKKKQTSQSAHKKQPLDDTQITSLKVAEVGPNADVGTIGGQSEIKQPIDQVQMSSLEVTEAGPIPDVGTIGAQIEIKQPVDVQMSSPEVAQVGTDPGVDTIGLRSEVKQPYNDVQTCSHESLLSGKQENSLELESFDDETPFGKNLSHIQMTPVSISDGTHEQNLNEEVYVESGIFTAAVNLETSVLKSGRPDASEKEMDLTESGSTSKGLQTDVMVEEPLVSLDKVVVVEEVEISSLGVDTKGDTADADNTCDFISYDVGSSAVLSSSIQQSDVKSEYMRSAVGDKLDGLGSVQISSLDKHDHADDGEQFGEDESVIAQKPLLSKPGSEDRGVAGGVDVQENPFSGNDVYGDFDNVISDLRSGLNMFGKVPGNGIKVPKEAETGSEPSNAEKIIQVSVSGHDVDIERVLEDNSDVQDGEPEHYQLTSNDNHATDEEDAEGDDPALNECIPVVADVLIRSHDQEPEQILNIAVDDVPCDTVGQADSLTNKDTPKTLATSGIDERVDAPEESVPDITKDVVSSILGDIYDMDAEDNCGNEQKWTEVDEGFQPKVAEVLIRSHDQEPEQILNIAVDVVPCDTVGQSDSVTNEDAPKTLATSGIDDVVVRVDAPEETVPDINKDVVSSILGDIQDMDAEDNCGNEQKWTDVDEGFQPKESGDISPDVSNEQTKDEVGTSRGNVHTLDDQEQTAATDYVDNDGDNFMEDGSRIGVNEVGSELVGKIKAHEDPTRGEAPPLLYTKGEHSSPLNGDISAHESLITKESLPITYEKEESPVEDTDSDLPTIKEEDRNKQEATQNAGTSVDWGDYDFGLDEFEKPHSADGKCERDGQDSDLQTSDGTSFSVEESSGLRAGLAHPLRNLEKDSINAADGKSKQDVDELKETANAADMTDEVFNWSDSSLRSLFVTPAATRTSNVKDSQEHAVNLASQDTYSSLKPLFKTPGITQISHVKDGQEDAVSFAKQDPYSSLKTLFTTPATTQISHGKYVQVDATSFANKDSSMKPLHKTPAVAQISRVKDGQEDAVSFANQDPYSSLKPLFTTPATTQTSHVKDTRDNTANFTNRDHYSSLKSLFTTPATSRTRHVNDSKADAVPYGRFNDNMGTSATATREFNHQSENDQFDAFGGETQCNADQDPENEMYGVPSFEDYPLKLFGEDDVGGSIDVSRSNTHFEFKGDQDEQIKQFDSLSEAAGTSLRNPSGDPSGLKDDSIHGRELEKNEETLMKGSETDDDLAFDTGDV